MSAPASSLDIVMAKRRNTRGPKGPRKRTGAPSELRTGPSASDVHEVVFYRAADGSMPARDYLDSLPKNIRARIRRVAVAVAEAPPTKFAGGGMWEAMHGELTGWHEIRVTGPIHYRVFCLLDLKAEGVGKPLLVLVDGRTKPSGTKLSPSEYAKIRDLGEDYKNQQPRPIG